MDYEENMSNIINFTPHPGASNLMKKEFPNIAHGHVTAFLLDEGLARGRIVRLGTLCQQLKDQHQYPDCVNQVLLEMIALGAMLIGDLKAFGKIILQITNGALINLAVIEITTEGKVRACAKFQEEYFNTTAQTVSFKKLFEGGQFVVSTRFDDSQEIHQAIVEITGETLADSISHYFLQSVQIPNFLTVAFDAELFNNLDAYYPVGALMIQKMPSYDLKDSFTREEEENIFEEIQLLSRTLKTEELQLKELSDEKLLFRLFHEHSLKCYPSKGLYLCCSCSVEKIIELLQSFPEEELKSMKQQKDACEFVCEFCSHVYRPFEDNSFD